MWGMEEGRDGVLVGEEGADGEVPAAVRTGLDVDAEGASEKESPLGARGGSEELAVSDACPVVGGEDVGSEGLGVEEDVERGVADVRCGGGLGPGGGEEGRAPIAGGG